VRKILRNVTPRPARRGSLPIAAWQRQRLDDREKRELLQHAYNLEKLTYRQGTGRHGGVLRDTALKVLRALLFRAWSRHSVCDPSLSQLATWTQLDRKTVQAAIKRLEEANLLRKIRRGLVVGVRFVQWTNAYLFLSSASWRSEGSYSQAVEHLLKEKRLRRQKTPVETLTDELINQLRLAGGPGL
jgi:DNA-binding transcriptional regulator YhcF (GntR family)